MPTLFSPAPRHLHGMMPHVIRVQISMRHTKLSCEIPHFHTMQCSTCSGNVFYICVARYDAVTVEGKLAWQDSVTPLNRPFFDAADAIFINYTWKADAPRQLVENLPAAARRNVFMGIDVFGRGTLGGGGMACDVALNAAAVAGLSSALFAPGWVYEKHDRAQFPQLQEAFWGKVRGTRWLCIDSMMWKVPVVMVFDPRATDAACGGALAEIASLVQCSKPPQHGGCCQCCRCYAYDDCCLRPADPVSPTARRSRQPCPVAPAPPLPSCPSPAISTPAAAPPAPTIAARWPPGPAVAPGPGTTCGASSRRRCFSRLPCRGAHSCGYRRATGWRPACKAASAPIARSRGPAACGWHQRAPSLTWKQSNQRNALQRGPSAALRPPQPGRWVSTWRRGPRPRRRRPACCTPRSCHCRQRALFRLPAGCSRTRGAPWLQCCGLPTERCL